MGSPDVLIRLLGGLPGSCGDQGWIAGFVKMAESTIEKYDLRVMRETGTSWQN